MNWKRVVVGIVGLGVFFAGYLVLLSFMFGFGYGLSGSQASPSLIFVGSVLALLPIMWIGTAELVEYVKKD